MAPRARVQLRSRRRARARGCQGRRAPVSLDLQKMIWDDPEPRGQSKYVLLHLASYVKKDAWDGGGLLLAWPSQNTIARKCGIPRSSVERALASLAELEKIRDTGQRRQRRTIVWELYPSTAPNVTAGWELTNLPDSRAGHPGDLPDDGASETNLPDYRAGVAGASDDLPDSHDDLPDPSTDLPDSRAGTCPTTGHKREEEVRTTEIHRERRRASARESGEGDDLAGELAEVERLLEDRPADRLLTGRRDELRDSLGAAA